MKSHVLRMRSADKDIFEAIGTGKKSVETRAASVKNRIIKPGDKIVFVCGSKKLSKDIKTARIYKTVGAMLKKYKVKEIAPHLKTESELRDMYFKFPTYREKIKKFGIIAFELK